MRVLGEQTRLDQANKQKPGQTNPIQSILNTRWRLRKKKPASVSGAEFSEATTNYLRPANREQRVTIAQRKKTRFCNSGMEVFIEEYEYAQLGIASSDDVSDPSYHSLAHSAVNSYYTRQGNSEPDVTRTHDTVRYGVSAYRPPACLLVNCNCRRLRGYIYSTRKCRSIRSIISPETCSAETNS